LLWPPLPKKRGKEALRVARNSRPGDDVETPRDGMSRMLVFIHVFSICVVAAILFVSVDEIEPNRRYASVLKLLIVFVSAVAIARRLMP
jgi:hypothetical protein